MIVHGETFPAKKLKENIRAISVDGPSSSDIAGCIEVGDWLTEHQMRELKKLMRFPQENPSTVFQIIVNVKPIRRLICEWPHTNSDDLEDKYYFTQLVDLDA